MEKPRLEDHLKQKQAKKYKQTNTDKKTTTFATTTPKKYSDTINGNDDDGNNIKNDFNDISNREF